jgi:hypothetical protein
MTAIQRALNWNILFTAHKHLTVGSYNKSQRDALFKVCKSVHHHTIQINHRLDATISPVYYPDVYLQLSMFRAPAHRQELNNCSSNLWFYLRIVVIAVLLFVFEPAQTRTTARLSPLLVFETKILRIFGST